MEGLNKSMLKESMYNKAKSKLEKLKTLSLINKGWSEQQLGMDFIFIPGFKFEFLQKLYWEA